MMEENNFYQNYYEQCMNCSVQINDCVLKMNSFDLLQTVDSGLSGMDYSFAMILGLIGACISSSKNVEKFLDKIHQIASEGAKSTDAIFEKVVKFLFGHKGDYIDSVPVNDAGKTARKFVTRTAKNDGNLYIMSDGRTGPHRIFWGHDIFSFKKDNPFYIMQKQLPGLQGILQAIKHLTADTFSRQGLPIPTSSWFDYSYTNEKGVKKVGNKLLDFCNDLYKKSSSKDKISVTGANNDVFNHIFSVHIQDFGVQKIGAFLCDRYLSYRKINDRVIQHQFKLIFSAVLFYMNSLCGSAKYGIPYINWPAGLYMIKEMICMLYGSNRETKQLQKVTDDLLKQTDELENRIINVNNYFNRICGGAE